MFIKNLTFYIILVSIHFSVNYFLHTEEFVLIPRQRYANEQPQITQFLNNKSVREKEKQISVLQRNKSPPVLCTTQQDTQQQTYNMLENVRDELNETKDEKIDTKVSTEIRERVLREFKHLDKKSSKANIILEKIEEPESLSIDRTSRLMVIISSTGFLVADFFFDLQQTTTLKL